MIKINLVAETPAAAPARRKRPEFSLGAKQGDMILLITLAIGLVIVGGRWYLLASERNHLREIESQRRVERDELKQYIDQVEELEAKRAELIHKIDVINKLKEAQRGPVRILDEVSRALPELVWLTNLKLKGTALTLEGVAMDENAVANYISNLDASPFVQEQPVLKDMARAREDTFRFVLTCSFTYTPPELTGGTGAAGAGA